MSFDDETEFDLLRRRAEPLGLHVQRHRTWDPARGGGDLYIMPKRRYRGEHVETYLKYSTVDEIHKFLNEVGRN
jgi:hypothetical protein